MQIDVRPRNSLQFGGDIYNGQTQAVMLNASIEPDTSLQIFAQVLVMTKGAPENSTRVFVQHIRDVSFLSLTMGYGAALSFILFIVIVILTFIQFKIMKINWEY